MNADFGLDLRSSYAELWIEEKAQRNAGKQGS